MSNCSETPVIVELLEALKIARDALQHGFENCDEDPDCFWADPLAAAIAAIANAEGDA